MTHQFVYITTESIDQAKAIGRQLVQERLAACVNILPSMTSLYRWQGKLEEANEVVLIAKTRESLSALVVQRVKELHSYQCPCVVLLPVVGGSQAFLDWIDEETTEPG